MTEQEKIEKFDTLQILQTRIAGCFGEQDKIFAGHALDQKHATELRKLAKDNGITLFEIQNIVAGYLFRTNVIASHVIEQTKKASDFFSKKLN